MRRLSVYFILVLLALALALLVREPATALSPTTPAAPLQDPILSIPIVNEADVDGDCSEYAEAVSETFTYPNGSTGTVYLQHDSSNLYVCLEAPAGTFTDRFGSVYLDPQADGASYTFARQDDYGFWINIPGNTRRTVQGNSLPNGWSVMTGMDGLWNGFAATSNEGDTAEWMINTGRFGVELCDLFGIAVYHHWFAAIGDDYGWPSNQWFDQPRTWQLAQIGGASCDDPGEGHIAYVFRGDTVDATSFFNLLTGAGYLVDLIPLSDVISTDFTVYDLIIIADDSGYLNDWGQPGFTAQQVARITAPEPDVPIIGLGEGGYAFFGQLGMFIGWPNGWHGPMDSATEAATAPAGYFSGAGPVHQLYTAPVNEVGIYLGPEKEVPPDLLVIGLEPPSPDHASLIQQGCRQLWGFSGNPNEMTANGSQTFLNAVDYVRSFQCTPEIPPADECVSIEKVADPPAGTAVQPGQIITYTINYVWSDNPQCENAQTTRIIDFVPFDTLFVPGSATGNIIPQADGALVWPVFQDSSEQQVSFKVRVSDTQCFNQATVANQARLLVPYGPTQASAVITHPVDCPDIIFPNDEPPYAEEEVQIHPYPLVSNQPSTITVKVSNTGPTPKTVTVSFQTSPNKFGIGLNFNTFASEVVTIPPYSNVIVKTTYTPVVPGHYCIQVVVQGSEPGDPVIKTQRNLDVTEDLEPGVADDLVFKVGNPTAATADIQLIVDNTCPGWTATVDPTILFGMTPGEVRDATLTVTPPNPFTLGTACHIDVQGWIGDELIGGIRKIDVPPVHLPVEVEPPWMEEEITVIPDPPVTGQPGQICVELQNPLNAQRTVTLDYAVADFGAGIWFTSVGTRTATLPANSLADYCINWTPEPGGTLHRCLLVTLIQPGYHDQTSQRNVNVVKGTMIEILDMKLPLLVRNPDLGPHLLEFDITTYGLGPEWDFAIIRENGQPAPRTIEPGETLNLNLDLLLPAAQRLDLAPEQLPDYGFGDEIRIEVGVLLDGQLVGGVSYILEPPAQHVLFLPAIWRE